MDPFKQLFNGSEDIDPPKRFITSAKARLMHRIQVEKEQSFFQKYFKKTRSAEPSNAFVQAAKIRLLSKIDADRGLAKWRLFFAWLKRVTASVMVMVMVATTAMFSVDSGKLVQADHAYTLVSHGDFYFKRADEEMGRIVSADQQLQVGPGDLIRTLEAKPENNDQSAAVTLTLGGNRAALPPNAAILITDINAQTDSSGQRLPYASTVTLSLQGAGWFSASDVQSAALDFQKDYALRVITDGKVVDLVNGSAYIKPVDHRGLEVQVFREKARVYSSENATESENRISLLSNQKILLGKHRQNAVLDLTEQDKQHAFSSENLSLDLAFLKQQSDEYLQDLFDSVGALPGDYLVYDLERIEQHITGMDETDRAALLLNDAIAIALGSEKDSTRPHEAFLTPKEQQKLIELLNEFRKITQDFADGSVDKQEVAHKVILPSKRLLATLPPEVKVSADLKPIKEVLQEVEEEFAEQNPSVLEAFKNEKRLEDLKDAKDYVALDMPDKAEEVLKELSVSSSEDDPSDSLEPEMDSEETLNEEALRKKIEHTQEELALIESIQETLTDDDAAKSTLVDAVGDVRETASFDLETALALVSPPPILVAAAPEPEEPELIIDPGVITLAQEVAQEIDGYQKFKSMDTIYGNALYLHGDELLSSPESKAAFTNELILALEGQVDSVSDMRFINILERNAILHEMASDAQKQLEETIALENQEPEADVIENLSEEAEADDIVEDTSEKMPELSIEDENTQEIQDTPVEQEEDPSTLDKTPDDSSITDDLEAPLDNPPLNEAPESKMPSFDDTSSDLDSLDAASDSIDEKTENQKSSSADDPDQTIEKETIQE